MMELRYEHYDTPTLVNELSDRHGSVGLLAATRLMEAEVTMVESKQREVMLLEALIAVINSDVRTFAQRYEVSHCVALALNETMGVRK